jgi:hypothetical protein
MFRYDAVEIFLHMFFSSLHYLGDSQQMVGNMDSGFIPVDFAHCTIYLKL